MRRILVGLLALSMPAAVQAQTAPSTVIGGQYNDAVPAITLSDKQTAAAQMDANGNILIVSGSRPTYSAGILALAMAASPTDVFCIQGSATKLIRVKRVDISNLTTVSLATVPVSIVKRSTANTGGTATNPPAVPHDTLNPAATATISAYTANPTTGTLVGVIDPFYITASTATTQNNERTKLYGVEDMQSMSLRGTGESTCINFGGGTITGNVSIGIDWIEQPL
jgi:hypothetical protein